MQVVYKIAIVGEYLVDHCWIVTCDHSWTFDHLSLSHVSIDRPLMNGTATQQFATQANEVNLNSILSISMLIRRAA